MDPMGEMLEEDDRPAPQPKPAREAAIYGVVVALALFFVGWITGMGGAFWANLAFSLAMGALAAVLFLAVKRYGGRLK